MAKFILFFKALKGHVWPKGHAKHHLMHYGHELAHAGYLGAVFVEGHGLYASFGGVLLIFVLAALVWPAAGGE